MAEGLASGVANAILDALCRSVAWTEPAAFYVQLHTGAPGAAGTSNVATETDRQAVTFSAASALPSLPPLPSLPAFEGPSR